MNTAAFATKEQLPGAANLQTDLFVGADKMVSTSGTMDSREIAAMTGKNHADVCRDIRKMLADLETDESRFAFVYPGILERIARLLEATKDLRPLTSIETEILALWDRRQFTSNRIQPSRPYSSNDGTNYPGVLRLREQILAVGAPLTMGKIFEEVLTPAGIKRSRGVEMAVSAILREDGYLRKNRKYTENKSWVYVKPV